MANCDEMAGTMVRNHFLDCAKSLVFPKKLDVFQKFMVYLGPILVLLKCYPKTFQELRHHVLSISSPCRYELSASSSDFYSCAGNSGTESEEELIDLSSPPKTFFFLPQ